MYTYDYPRPALTVDIVVFRSQGNQLQVLLIQRSQDPFRGLSALPGGFIEIEESIELAAARELAEETGLAGINLEQVHTYGDPHRDPRGRVVSVAYFTYLPPETSISIRKGGDAEQTGWFPFADLPELAFDHRQIIQDAYVLLRDQIGE